MLVRPPDPARPRAREESTTSEGKDVVKQSTPSYKIQNRNFGREKFKQNSGGPLKSTDEARSFTTTAPAQKFTVRVPKLLTDSAGSE